RERPPDFAHGLREMLRSAIRKVVTIDARDHHVFQTHSRGHARHVAGLLWIEPHILLLRAGLGHRAEAAAAGTPVAQDHERRHAAMEALVNVRAARRLANRVQVQLPQTAFQAVERFGMRPSFARPFRQAWTGAPQPDLYECVTHYFRTSLLKPALSRLLLALP